MTMCPVPWASWSLWIAQVVFAVAGTCAMVYLTISNWRQTRRWKERDAMLDAGMIQARERFEAALSQQPGRPRIDA